MRDLRVLSRQLSASLALLGSLWIVSVPAFADGDCAAVLINGARYQVIPANFEVTKDPTKIIIEDVDNGFEVSAVLENRNLEIVIELVNHRHKQRSELRGSQAYAMVIEHFGLQNISVIEGIWVNGDNLKSYRQGRRAGLSRKDAAKATWSGIQAAKYGFSEVRTVFDKQDHHGSMVQVEFVRPLTEVQGEVHFEKSSTVFAMRDLDFGFSFRGTLAYGRLEITATLENELKGIRSSQHGADLYRQMIQHFGVKNIKTIAGIWTAGTNHQQYSNFIRKGLEPEEAAAQTWSGVQAAKYGFSLVTLAIGGTWSSGKKYILAEFERP